MPRFVPNNKLSINVSGIAAQFCEMNGLPERWLSLWILCANSSFPVPVSPTRSMEEDVRITLFPSAMVD